MKTAILGAGVSGLTAARLIKEKGGEVTVFEKNGNVGGLARTRFTEGYLYDPHGGHIFNSKRPEVVDFVFSVLPKERWQYTARNAKIYMNGRFISYPFELSLCELDVDTAVECAYGFMSSCEGEESDNFRDWLTWNFGKGIAETYLIPYNEKIWAYPLEDMETKWMQGKMPLPTKRDILRSLYLKDPTERKMPHSTFYYPIEGGIQTFVDALAEGLDLRLGCDVKSIEKREGKWFINGEGGFDRIVSTIPLTLLPGAMELPDKVKDHIGRLRYNSLTTVLFDCPETDITWLYIPSHDFRSHRIGYQSTLTPKAGCAPGRGVGALEIIGDRFEVTPELAERKDILPEELGFSRVIDSEFTQFAYVIHDKNYRESTGVIKDYFARDDSFFLLGRWGTWNYNNMDLCMADAMELVKENF